MNKQISEVEKLYKLAELNNLWLEEYYASDNVHPVQIWHKSYNEMIKSMMKTNAWARSEAIEVAKKECRKALPPFTAEKQLELIKWLASSRKGILISDMGEGEEGEFNISTGFYYCAKHIQNFRKNKDLGVVIAEFINNLWQDLTEDEKQQVKGILE